MKLVYVNNNRLVTDSIVIAETFGKRHADVLRSIESMECSQEFTERNFALSDYQDSTGRTLPKYFITQDGFSFIAFGFTGKEAARFKETYINEFNRMKDELNKPLYVLPQTMVEAVESYLVELKRSEALQIQNNQLSLESAEQKQKLKEQETPIAIYNLAIKAGNTLSMQEVAKSLGTGRTRLYDFLREKEIIMKHSTLPYQRFLDAGLFKVTERPRTSGDTIVNDPATRVTAKGFDYIAKLLTAN